MKTITKEQAKKQKLTFSGFETWKKVSAECIVFNLKKKFPNANIKIVEEKENLTYLFPKVKYYVWGNISYENYKLGK